MFFLLYFNVFTVSYSKFTVFWSISRHPGWFSRPPNDSKTVPKRSQNYLNSIPKLTNNYSKIIPKRSRNDPNMSPKCISASAHPHSRPSAHIHPPPEPQGSRVLWAAPERERGVWLLFAILQHFLTPRAGFRRPGRGLGSVFSGSGGEMARRNRPSYSWVKNLRFCHLASKYRKIP